MNYEERFYCSLYYRSRNRRLQALFLEFPLTDLRQVSVGAFVLPVMCPRLSLLTRQLSNFLLDSCREMVPQCLPQQGRPQRTEDAQRLEARTGRTLGLPFLRGLGGELKQWPRAQRSGSRLGLKREHGAYRRRCFCSRSTARALRSGTRRAA